MAKEYFSHDYGTRSKIKMAALLEMEKVRGYGLFWIIVEMMHENTNNWLDLEEYTYLAIKKESGEDIDYIRDFIKKCIGTYKVFIEGEGKFTTERVLRNIEKREDITEKRRSAGKKSAELRASKPKESEQTATSVEQVLSKIEQTPTKETKLKEIKLNEIKDNTEAKASVVLSDDAMAKRKELKKSYSEFSKQLEGKPKVDIWNGLKSFITENSPDLIEPYGDIWNLFAGTYKLSQIKGYTDSRRKKFDTRIREPDFDFLQVLEKIKTSGHLKGDNNQKWKVTFDWIFENDKNYLKILEENYN